MKRRIAIGAAAVLLLALAFVGGRYSAPVEVRERVTERMVMDEAAVASAVASARAEWQRETKTRVLIRTVYKDGKPAERTETRDTDSTASGASSSAAASSSASSAHAEAQKDSQKVTISGRPGWSVGVGGVWDPGRLDPSPSRVLLSLDRRVLGPVWLGASASVRPSSSLDPLVGVSARVEW